MGQVARGGERWAHSRSGDGVRAVGRQSQRVGTGGCLVPVVAECCGVPPVVVGRPPSGRGATGPWWLTVAIACDRAPFRVPSVRRRDCRGVTRLPCVYSFGATVSGFSSFPLTHFLSDVLRVSLLPAVRSNAMRHVRNQFPSTAVGGFLLAVRRKSPELKSLVGADPDRVAAADAAPSEARAVFSCCAEGARNSCEVGRVHWGGTVAKGARASRALGV